jgi:hypothetical protein
VSKVIKPMKKPARILFFAIIIVILIASLALKRGGIELPECEPFEGAQVCTEQYQPVCAKTDDSQKTFGNLCKACIAAQSEGVTSILEGECE